MQGARQGATRQELGRVQHTRDRARVTRKAPRDTAQARRPESTRRASGRQDYPRGRPARRPETPRKQGAPSNTGTRKPPRPETTRKTSARQDAPQRDTKAWPGERPRACPRRRAESKPRRRDSEGLPRAPAALGRALERPELASRTLERLHTQRERATNSKPSAQGFEIASAHRASQTQRRRDRCKRRWQAS